jgi:Cys-tRNA(Pro)/Cys-tRNA(Cys) deacylase
VVKRKAVGGTPAVQALERAGVPHTLHPYDHDPRARSFGAEAADVLGVDPARVFKTLVAQADEALVVGIVPVSRWLDLKALARAVGARRAAMAEPSAAQLATGYVLGGISPLGQKRGLPTVLDESALAHDTILVSAGRRGLDVELTPSDLVSLTSATTAAITQSTRQSPTIRLLLERHQPLTSTRVPVRRQAATVRATSYTPEA